MKWYRINALLLKYWYVTINTLDRVFDVVFWPLMGILLWSFTTYYVEDMAQNSLVASIFLGGAIMWTFLQRADNDITFYVLEDFWSGNVFSMFSSPVKESEIVISTALWGLFRSLVSFLVMVVVVFLLHNFNLFSIGILSLATATFGLLLFGWTMGIFILGLIFRYGSRIQVFSWSIGWLIQPFSAVFYPVSSLPVWLQNVSLWFPPTYIFEGLRYSSLYHAVNWAYYAKAILLTIVLFILACLFFHRSLIYARRIGLFTRPNP